MTTSTAPTPARTERARRTRGFTLVEVMVSAAIGTVLFAAVLSVVVLQARLSTGVGNYADMNANSRQAMSLFEREMRTAKTITTMTDKRIEGLLTTGVSVPTLKDKSPVYEYATVAYYYDTAARALMRQETGKAPTVVLADVETCSFNYFNKNDAPAATTADVKKILISATMRRTVLGNANSDYLVSAMVTMRNRIVTS